MYKLFFSSLLAAYLCALSSGLCGCTTAKPAQSQQFSLPKGLKFLGLPLTHFRPLPSGHKTTGVFLAQGKPRPENNKICASRGQTRFVDYQYLKWIAVETGGLLLYADLGKIFTVALGKIKLRAIAWPIA